MRTALLFALLSVASYAAPPARRPVVALLPPGTSDEGLTRLGLLIEARTSELLEQSNKFSELHLKQVYAMADTEGLLLTELDEPKEAARAKLALGADVVATLSLEKSADGIALSGVVMEGKKSTPFTAKLAASSAQALSQGSEAMAAAVLATQKAKLPKNPSAQPESKSDEAVDALGECYAMVIRQPLGIDTPVLLMGEELDTAALACQRAVKADPTLRYAVAVDALARTLLGEDGEAAKEMVGLSAADDVVEPFSLARFWIVTRYQTNEDGVASLRDVRKKHPGELLALNYLAETLGVLGDLPGSTAAWKEYVQLVPNSPFGHGRLSRVLAQQGKFDEAIAEAKTALKLAPEGRDARLQLGGRYIDAKKIDLAIETLAPLTELPDHKGEHYARLGYAYWLQGSESLAGPLFQKALDYSKAPSEWRTRGRSLYNLAQVEIARGRKEQAKAALRDSMNEGFHVKDLDPKLVPIADELAKEKSAAKVTKESSLVPVDEFGNPVLNAKKAAPPQGYTGFKF